MTFVPAPETASDEVLVLATVATLVAEIASASPVGPVELRSRLDELGLDSLALVELRARLEQAFAVELADRVLAGAETPADWLDAVRAAQGRPVGRRPSSPAPIVLTGDAAAPTGARTLLDALAWHAGAHPDRLHVRVVHLDLAGGVAGPAGGPGAQAQELTYGALLESARGVAGGLRAAGTVAGDTVALMLPTGRAYFEAFTGVLLAGAVPVPLYPPARPSGLDEHLRRQVGILRSARAALLLTDRQVMRVARLLRPHVASLRGVRTVEQLRTAAPVPSPAPAGPDTLALVQYTSGSTGNPKGVVLTHEQLLANIRAMGALSEAGPADVFVSWLPLYHDMGLIGAWLASLYFGFPLVVMPSLAFLARPARWLQAISAYGGTLSASPNFGYELCLRHVRDDELAGVDLSSWRLAFNGAEPVSAETISRFSERFGGHGFRSQSMAPVYGLAEVGVGLCFPPLRRPPVVDVVDHDELSRTGQAVPAVPASERRRLRRVVGCGSALPGYEVRVVDASGRELPDRREGRIEFAGPSATAGYLHDERATRALRHGRWLDTGDLGYLAGGELYVTGRAKDIVIRAGRNLDPHELEEAVGELAGVRKGCVAAFASIDPALGTERLVVVAETRLGAPSERAELRRRVAAAGVDVLGTPPDDVVLAPPGAVAKTTSGKIRRSATRERYETGSLGRPVRGVRRQMAGVVASGLRARAAGTARRLAALAYGTYVWALLLAVAPATWVAVVVVPGRRRRWALVRTAGHLVGRLSGIRIVVDRPMAAPRRSAVFVANHASFLDSLALALVLEQPVTFAAGEVLGPQHVAGPFLRALGCVFVHRDEPVRAEADVAALATELRTGRSLALFPEGGLDPVRGLRPFHLGAFAAAAAAGAAVVPIGLSGSREVVAPGGRMPHRGTVRVAVGEPITAPGAAFGDVLALRDRARAAVESLSKDGGLRGTFAPSSRPAPDR